MASLPSGYQQVEYIQSSGTQYIDTGFQPNQNTRVVADLEYLSGDAAFCAYSQSNGSNSFGLQAVSSGYWFVYYGSSSKQTECQAKTGRYIVDVNKNVVMFNDTTTTLAANNFTCDSAIWIFALKFNGNPSYFSSLKIYYFKIYDNGTLVRDFVPCYRTSDNAAGLYDTAQGAFYTNAGTGSFSVGSNVTPSEPAGPVPEIVLPFPFAMRRRRLMMAGSAYILYNGVKYKRGQTLTISSSVDIQIVGKVDLDVILVGAGGGGAGGDNRGGLRGYGGGSGGKTERIITIVSGVYSLIVGTGGAGSASGALGGPQAGSGGNTSGFGLSAGGGGGGRGSSFGGTAGAGGAGDTPGNPGTTNSGGASVYNGYGAGGQGGSYTAAGSRGGNGVAVITIL